MEKEKVTLNLRRLYRQFDAPVTEFDCGEKCRVHNPGGKPFCCDICQAVPVAFHQEWEYFQQNTDLWRPWRGDECAEDPGDPDDLRSEIPEHMLPLACLGPDRCQRAFRATSCRQFPFFPYITRRGDFIGLAYEWAFEEACWVISNLGSVTDRFRREFVAAYDALLTWDAEFEGYANLSEQMREDFSARKRRIPLLHRRGGSYLISPGSERLVRIPPEKFRKFGPYTKET